MALINCPECNKEISNKSKVCIHCGYPIVVEKNTKCIINGKEHDLSFILDTNSENKIKIISTFMKITNCGLADAKKVVEDILKTNEIPKTLFLQQSKQQESSVNQPKCPTCGSTNLLKVSTMSKAGSVFMWGLLSQKVKKTWHCNSCGYEW